MHQMTLNWHWTINSQTHPLYTKYLPREAQILVRFALQPAILEVQDCGKSEMHRIASKWP